MPQGQGHRTVLAQVVADALGLKPQDIRVITEMDTAQGRLVDRLGQLFQPLCPGGRRRRANRRVADLRERLARIAAAQLNVAAAEIDFADGRVAARSIRTMPYPFRASPRPAIGPPALIAAEIGQTMRGDGVLDAAAN